MEKSRDVWTISSLLNWTINYFNLPQPTKKAEIRLINLTESIGRLLVYLAAKFSAGLVNASSSSA